MANHPGVHDAMTNTHEQPIPAPAPVNCPQCGHKGTRVGRITLDSLLTQDAATRIGDGLYRYCDAIDCDTVYFGDDGTTFVKSDLTVRVGVKERESPRPVCYCFDHTIEEIEQEIAETGQCTVLDDIKARLKSGCWCETTNPQGSCCLGTVSKRIKQAMTEHGHDDRTTIEQENCCANSASERLPNQKEEMVMSDCCNDMDTSTDDGVKRQRTGMLAVAASAVAAIASSACCWIPLTLIVFGVSAGGVSAWFEQYRWLFLGLTTVLLVTGFYLVYYRSPRCAAGSACATPVRGLARFNRVMLWTATVFVIAMAAFPKYVAYLMPKAPVVQITETVSNQTTASIDIEGMTCEGCAVNLRNTLVKVPGVLDATIQYDEGSAAIRFDPSAPPETTDLANAIEGLGYNADLSAIKHRDK
jgi:copper chaperone CopZ